MGLKKKDCFGFLPVGLGTLRSWLAGAAKLFTSICKKTLRKNVAQFTPHLNKNDLSNTRKRANAIKKEREEGTHI